MSRQRTPKTQKRNPTSAPHKIETESHALSGFNRTRALLKYLKIVLDSEANLSYVQWPSTVALRGPLRARSVELGSGFIFLCRAGFSVRVPSRKMDHTTQINVGDGAKWDESLRDVQGAHISRAKKKQGCLGLCRSWCFQLFNWILINLGSHRSLRTWEQAIAEPIRQVKRSISSCSTQKPKRLIRRVLMRARSCPKFLLWISKHSWTRGWKLGNHVAALVCGPAVRVCFSFEAFVLPSLA